MVRTHFPHPLLFATLFLVAFTMTSAMAKDARFIVIARHTPEECLKTLDDVSGKSSKLLATFDWGCMVGDHTGYATIEAKDEAAVKAMLPADMRDVKIVKLNKFTPQQIKSFHEKH
jgi:hypothetical protein